MPVTWTNNRTDNKWSVGDTATFTATGDLPDWITNGNFHGKPRYVESNGTSTQASGNSDGVSYNHGHGELTITVKISMDMNDWTVQVHGSNDSTKILRWPGFGATSATWADPGCQANDAESGDLTHLITRTYEQQNGDNWSSVNKIDQAAGGTYRITYNVTDGNLNAAPITRVVTLTVPAVEPTQEVGNWASGKPSARNGSVGAAGNHFMYVQSDQLWNHTTGDQTMGYYLQMPCADSGRPAHSSMEITHVSGTFTWEQARLDALGQGGQLACIRYTSQHEWVSCLNQSGWLGGVRVQYRQGSDSDGDIDNNAINDRMYWYWTDSTTPVSIVETSSMTPRDEMTRHLACGHASGKIQASVPETSPCAPESTSPCDQSTTTSTTVFNTPLDPQLPTPGARAHFGGGMMNGAHDIFVDDWTSEFVGMGDYPKNTEAFPSAAGFTFDGIAIDTGVRCIIYSEENFQGDVLIDITGPAIVNNAEMHNVFPVPGATDALALAETVEMKRLREDDTEYNSVSGVTISNKNTLVSPLRGNDPQQSGVTINELFPESVRYWSDDLVPNGNHYMQTWSFGSLKLRKVT